MCHYLWDPGVTLAKHRTEAELSLYWSTAHCTCLWETKWEQDHLGQIIIYLSLRQTVNLQNCKLRYYVLSHSVTFSVAYFSIKTQLLLT